MSGAWRLTYSLQSHVYSGDQNFLRLTLNGRLLGPETQHHTYNTGSGEVISTGGRVVILEASAGDTVSLRVTKVNGKYWQIYFCAEYISKM